ncbi:MAG: hypothetical protein GX079_05880, partial [Tissierellia bacterium]|nr:hypothetical protein [Tissierellia bacterium]
MVKTRFNSILSILLTVLLVFSSITPVYAQNTNIELMDVLEEVMDTSEELSPEDETGLIEEEATTDPGDLEEDLDSEPPLLQSQFAEVESFSEDGDPTEEEIKSFYLSAVDKKEVIIEPVKLEYVVGQTVKEALAASKYSFGGLEAGFIQSIEGKSGGFSIYMDDAGWDINRPATEVEVMAFYEGDFYSSGMISLIKAMGGLNERGDGAKNFPAVKTAYEAALKGLTKAGNDEALELLSKLNTALDSYDEYLSTGRLSLEIKAYQAGSPLDAVYSNFTDIYGNVTSSDTSNISLIPGSYKFVISDGGQNRTEGDLEVTEAGELSVNLPSGDWFGQIKLLDESQKPYDYDDENGSFLVDDTATSSSVRIYAEAGADVPKNGSTVAASIYADYIGKNGTN